MKIITNPRTKRALKISQEIIKLNSRIDLCEECVLTAKMNNDVNERIIWNDEKRKALEARDELFSALKMM